MNSTVLAAFALLLSAAAVPAEAAKYKMRWVLAHQNLDYFEEAAANFKDIVEKGSKGEISVSIETAKETPARAKDRPESMVADGRAEMGHSFTESMGSVDPRYWAFEAPYLMRSYEHMEGVIDGPVGDEMLKSLESKGMVGLALTYSGGASGVASTTREIKEAADLQGLKVGVYGDPVNEAWLKSLGATPVAIGHDLSSIGLKARTGELDAVVITWRNFERESLERTFDYMALMGSTYLVSVTYMNKKFYESLPPAYQELVMKASRETARIERAKTVELNASGRRALIGKGVRLVHQTEDQRRRFVAALEPAYSRDLETILGREFLTRVRRAPDGELWTPVRDFAGR